MVKPWDQQEVRTWTARYPPTDDPFDDADYNEAVRRLEQARRVLVVSEDESAGRYLEAADYFGELADCLRMLAGADPSWRGKGALAKPQTTWRLALAWYVGTGGEVDLLRGEHDAWEESEPSPPVTLADREIVQPIAWRAPPPRKSFEEWTPDEVTVLVGPSVAAAWRKERKDGKRWYRPGSHSNVHVCGAGDGRQTLRVAVGRDLFPILDALA